MPALHDSAARVRRVLPLLFVAGTAGAVLTRAYDDFDLLPTVAVTGVAAIILHLAVYLRERRALVRGLAIASAGSLVWWGALHAVGFVAGLADTVGAGGLALVVDQVIRAVRARDAPGDAGSPARELVLLWLVFPLATIAGLALFDETARALPRAWDARAYVLDTAFPVHAFHVGRLLERFAWMQPVARFVYEQIFLFLTVLVAMRTRMRTAPATDLLLVCAFASIVGQAGYYITPIVGPGFAFQAKFPDALPDITYLPTIAVPVPPQWARNCMPSIHTVWGLVFLWNTRPFGWAVRAFGAFVLVFTVLATLGLGYHYVVDLVAAVPFAAVAQAVGTRVTEPRSARLRWQVIGGGVALSLAWVVAPRWLPYGLAGVPGLLDVLALATIAAGVLGELALARATRTDPAREA